MPSRLNAPDLSAPDLSRQRVNRKSRASRE
jgi:hypothetical protein